MTFPVSSFRPSGNSKETVWGIFGAKLTRSFTDNLFLLTLNLLFHFRPLWGRRRAPFRRLVSFKQLAGGFEAGFMRPFLTNRLHWIISPHVRPKNTEIQRQIPTGRTPFTIATLLSCRVCDCGNYDESAEVAGFHAALFIAGLHTGHSISCAR